MKVLVVDDDPAIRAIAKLALESFGGHAVIVAATAEEALALAASERPDAVLLDVELGDTDGRTLIFDAPVVLLTGHEELAGIHKPFDPRALNAQLLVQLRGAR